VSCYFRHLKDIFAEAGIEVTPANKKQIDRAIHQFVGINYKDCPATGRKLKEEVLTNEKKRRELISTVKAAVK
jgi:predicted Fe-Mo cluster-binding NifX family protein